MVLAHMVYPYPQRSNKPDEHFAIAIETLNAYDIMDFVKSSHVFKPIRRDG